MKRNRVNELVDNQIKRKRTIFSFVCFIVIFALLLLSLIGVFIDKNKPYHVDYNEKGSVDYKVKIKENDFFSQEYLEKDNQYIASLIENITADFDYELTVDKDDIEYEYFYKVLAEVNVIEKNTNRPLYQFEETLVNEKSYNGYGNKPVNTSQSVEIDYNRYNDIIKRFISVYNLDDIVSTLDVTLYVNMKGNCDDLVEAEKNESAISLSIPLTTKTMAIDIGSNLIDQHDFLVCEQEDNSKYLVLFSIVGIGIVELCLIVYLIKYTISTRTAETIYERELKKILNNYRSYIQKINNDFELAGYQVLKVDTFTDMLEIRDTIQEPILMVENTEKTGTYFLIPSKTKILYSYGLKVSDIRKKMSE